jgi:hypothetical protein
MVESMRTTLGLYRFLCGRTNGAESSRPEETMFLEGVRTMTGVLDLRGHYGASGVRGKEEAGMEDLRKAVEALYDRCKVLPMPPHRLDSGFALACEAIEVMSGKSRP